MHCRHWSPSDPDTVRFIIPSDVSRLCDQLNTLCARFMTKFTQIHLFFINPLIFNKSEVLRACSKKLMAGARESGGQRYGSRRLQTRVPRRQQGALHRRAGASSGATHCTVPSGTEESNAPRTRAGPLSARPGPRPPVSRQGARELTSGHSLTYLLHGFLQSPWAEQSSTDHAVDHRQIRGSVIHELTSSWSRAQGLLAC